MIPGVVNNLAKNASENDKEQITTPFVTVRQYLKCHLHPITHISDFSTDDIPISAPLNIELNSARCHPSSPFKISGIL